MNYIVNNNENIEINELEMLIHINELRMYKTASSILYCEDDINEAIQRTIIIVFNNINKLRNKKSFNTWLTKILINECKKIWNQNIIKNKNSFSIDSMEYLVEKEKEDYSFVKEVIEKLDEKYREIVVLYYYDEFSVREISKILKIPQGTIKSRLSRAREQIKKMIKEDDFNE